MNKLCLICGEPRAVGRKFCRDCYLKTKAEKQRIRYDINKEEINKKRQLTLICVACGITYTCYHKDSKLCKSCLRLSKQYSFNNNNYQYGSNYYCWEHQKIAEECLGRELNKEECVHHIDWNGKNNNLNNLLVLDIKDHSKFHMLWNQIRFILEKTHMNFIWETKAEELTLIWLNENNMSYIHLKDKIRLDSFTDEHRKQLRKLKGY